MAATDAEARTIQAAPKRAAPRRVLRSRFLRITRPPPEESAGGIAVAVPPSKRKSIGAAGQGPAVVSRKNRSLYIDSSSFLRRFTASIRGLYRVFNDTEYRFYRSNSAPPEETDTPYATSTSLPDEPADTFADGTWYLSVSFFNGVIDSGFLPLGPNGETYLRIDLAGGVETISPPKAPVDVRLELRAGGVVRVIALYLEFGPLRAGEWSITFTTDGSTPGTPPAVSPTETELMPVTGVALLQHDLPAQANTTVVKVRLQSRRFDSPSWVYSEGSAVLTAQADALGPSVPLGADRWVGREPEDL